MWWSNNSKRGPGGVQDGLNDCLYRDYESYVASRGEWILRELGCCVGCDGGARCGCVGADGISREWYLEPYPLDGMKIQSHI